MDTTQATTATHKISWFVVLGGETFPRAAAMRGQWGYEVKCSCGWATHTGGAVQSYIRSEVRSHKLDVELGFA